MEYVTLEKYLMHVMYAMGQESLKEIVTVKVTLQIVKEIVEELTILMFVVFVMDRALDLI